MNKNILVVAGEASGDLHGAAVIRELKNIDKEISPIGIGGDRMIKEGLNVLYHINQMAFLGFIEVIKHIPFIRKVQSAIIEEVKAKNITTAVLIDYPGFNLSIAKKLKKMGVKIIYYISPQVWAWGKGRVKDIKKLVDKMVVILPFEKEFFEDYGINVEYAGHPLLEQIESYNYLTRNELNEKFNLDTNKEILLLLPGSRVQEVKKIFPQMISAASRAAEQLNMQVVVACSENMDESIFGRLTSLHNFTVIKKHTYDLYKHAKFGIIKSGTSTLEAGLFCLPMVVVYATNYLTYLIGKSLIKIESISLVNIVNKEKIVEELIQNDFTEDNIYNSCMKILSDKQLYDKTKEKLSYLKAKLGAPGASKKCANIIYSYIVGQ